MSVVEDYLDAKARWNAAKKAVLDVADRLQRVAGQLKSSPLRINFTDTGIDLPIEKGRGGPVMDYNPNVIPSAEELQLLLVEYHNARAEVDRAWRAVPEDYAGGLIPPEY